MMLFAVMRTQQFDDGSAEDTVALFTREADADALAEPYKQYWVFPFPVDEPRYLEQARSGVRPWHVVLWPPETGEQDGAFLADPDENLEQMRALEYGGFAGMVMATSEAEAIAAGWQAVHAKGLKASPRHITMAHQFVDFGKYLQPAETPFTSSLTPIADAKAEWGTGRINDVGVDESDKVWHDAVVPDDPGVTKEPGDDDEHDATDSEQSRTFWVDDGARWHHHWHGERQ